MLTNQPIRPITNSPIQPPITGAPESSDPAWSSIFDDWIDYDDEVSSSGFADLLAGSYIDLAASVAAGFSIYLSCVVPDLTGLNNPVLAAFNAGSDDPRMQFMRLTGSSEFAYAGTNVGGLGLSAIASWAGAPGAVQFGASIASGGQWFEFSGAARTTAAQAWSGGALNKLGVGTKGFTAGNDTGQTNKRLGLIYGAGSEAIMNAIAALF